MPDQPETPKASRLEILGAWLRLWTPPRDVEIPPIPWRKVAMGAGVLVLLAGFTALVIAPAIDEEKQRSAAEEQAALEQRAAARAAAQRREQRARTGPLAESDPLTAVERLVGTDAAKRFGTDGRPADCEPAAGIDTSAPRVVYDCHVVVRELRGAGQQEGARGALTLPYRAALDERSGRYAFCKTNPLPGEQALVDPRNVVELPRVCRRY